MFSIVLTPVTAMSADIVVQVRDLEGKSIAEADPKDGINTQIVIEVTGFNANNKPVPVPDRLVTVPDKISTKLSFPDYVKATV